jgi:hypothetical protein
MTKKAVLLTLGGLLFTVSVGDALAQRREARPGQQPRVRTGVPTKVGGPNCAAATSMDPVSGDMFNFADSDNSCSATNKVDDYNNAPGGPCNSVDYPGPDLIYRYGITGATNNVSVTLDAVTATADLALFVVSDCPNGTSCIGFEDLIGGGATENVAFTNQAVGSYWVYVDSYYTSGAQSCGNYTVTLTGTRPVELMDFKVE